MAENIYLRLKTAAQDGDVERLYGFFAEDPYFLDYFDNLTVCETPLHVAAEKGQNCFAMELIKLKPSLARKLNTSGWSPIHVALQNHNIQTVREFVGFDESLVRIRGRGGVTVLHHLARIGDQMLLAELLAACPSAIEDLTTKGETVLHVAVKNKQLMAFKFLLGWIEDLYILDLKDKDGSTLYNIAESTNQPEVMKLLRRVKSKNMIVKIAEKLIVLSLVLFAISRSSLIFYSSNNEFKRYMLVNDAPLITIFLILVNELLRRVRNVNARNLDIETTKKILVSGVVCFFISRFCLVLMHQYHV